MSPFFNSFPLNVIHWTGFAQSQIHPQFQILTFEIRLIVKSNLEIGNVLIVNNLKKPLNSEQDNFFMIPKVFNYASK